MGTIQNSLNQILASTLGAGFAVTQAPGIKQRIEKKAELQQLDKKKQELQQAENVGELDTETLKQFRRKQLELSKQALEIKPGEETYENVRKAQSLQPFMLPADPVGEQQAVQEIVTKQTQAIERKRGIKNAVKDRKALLDQLKKAGVNVDNPAIKITDNMTGEEIKR